MGKGGNTSDGREAEIRKVTIAGSAVNAALLVTKFVAGIAGHSAAMIADAVHSLSDFVTDLIVFVFVRISNKPEDKGHDYGHGKFETLATFLIGVILLCVGLGVFWSGVSAIYGFLFQEKELSSPGMIAFWTALASIVLKELLYRYTILEGKRLDSKPLVANAWHHRSDAFSSVGTAVGIGGAALLGDKWVILDPIAAVAVSVFICKVAVQLAIPCLDEFLDKSLPDETEQEILGILKDFPEVSDPHHLRTRRIGNYYAVEIHLRMDGRTQLAEAHEVASAIERRIKEVLCASTIVNIHLEPCK